MASRVPHHLGQKGLGGRCGVRKGDDGRSRDGGVVACFGGAFGEYGDPPHPPFCCHFCPHFCGRHFLHNVLALSIKGSKRENEK